MAQVLLISLRQQDPEAEIDLLAPGWCAPLASRMAQVDRLIPMPFGRGEVKLAARYRFAVTLRAESYDRAIVLPNTLKSALIPFWAQIPVRTGWRGEIRYGLLNDLRRLHKQSHISMSQRYGALAYPEGESLPARLPSPSLTVDAEGVARLRTALKLKDSGPVLALCPGAAGGPAKRWPAVHYGAVASHLVARGWQVWVFGAKGEEGLAQELVTGLAPVARKNVSVLVGRTRLEDVVDLLSCADAVVANDSGLMHIAAALARPLVALYGPTSPQFAPPLTSQCRILRLPLECSPCGQKICPLGHGRCMWNLKPDRVIQALDGLAGRASDVGQPQDAGQPQ